MAEKPSKPTVLVVDDAPETIDILGEVLRTAYNVRVARNGENALKILDDESPPDLVLLDINMPGVDGFDVCRHIKTHASLSDIPVIFITGYEHVREKLTGFAAGGVDYVTKPFHPEEVRARVKTHLDLQASKRELRESHDRLRRAEQLRDSLVHMIAHDMRSPLTIIMGVLDLIAMELKESEREPNLNRVDTARAAAGDLMDMVKTMLEVNKLESGAWQPVREPCDLNELITTVCDKAQNLAGDKLISSSLSGGLPRVQADPGLVMRVVQNLLENALKFSPARGEVRISSEPWRGGARISVTDAGPGIPPEHRERIFEKFGQVELRHTGTCLSTGLGLAFCKLAVEAHKGLIGVEPAPGTGSTLWFFLPGP